MEGRRTSRWGRRVCGEVARGHMGKKPRERLSRGVISQNLACSGKPKGLVPGVEMGRTHRGLCCPGRQQVGHPRSGLPLQGPGGRGCLFSGQLSPFRPQTWPGFLSAPFPSNRVFLSGHRGNSADGRRLPGTGRAPSALSLVSVF